MNRLSPLWRAAPPVCDTGANAAAAAAEGEGGEEAEDEVEEKEKSRGPTNPLPPHCALVVLEASRRDVRPSPRCRRESTAVASTAVLRTTVQLATSRLPATRGHRAEGQDAASLFCVCWQID
jgi:hypothetical protein